MISSSSSTTSLPLLSFGLFICFYILFSFGVSAQVPSGPLTHDWAYNLNQERSEFGHSVAFPGDVNNDGYDDVLVGAWIYDNGQCDEGGIFVFYGSAIGLPTSPSWTAQIDRHVGRLGSSLSGGDINGDGIADIVVGASYYDPANTDCVNINERGAVFAWFGSTTGLGPTGTFANADWSIIEPQSNARFGHSVAVGYVNSDSYADVIVGTPRFSNGQNQEGRVSVFLGAGSGPATSAAWTYESNQEGANFGWAVSADEDITNDGIDDILVGSAFHTSTFSSEGGAFLFPSSPTGPSPLPTTIGFGNQVGAYYGWSIAHLGDINGDNYNDVAVGAPFHNGASQNDIGRAYIYHGNGIGLSTSPNSVLENGALMSLFGFDVDGAGDVDGDNYNDVIISARDYDASSNANGAAYVYLGSSEGLKETPGCFMVGDNDGDMLGSSVAGGGNINADLFSDLVVGIESFSNISHAAGRVQVYSTFSCTILPVSVEFFDVAWFENASDVLLSWKIYSDLPLQKIEVERRGDQKTWEKVASINDNRLSSYTFIDRGVHFQSPSGSIQYRLKFVYYDSSFEYSSIKELNRYSIPLKIAFSNPVNDVLTLHVSEALRYFNIRVYNLEQKLILEETWDDVQGIQRIEITDVKNWAPGIYYMSFSSGKDFQVKKLFKTP